MWVHEDGDSYELETDDQLGGDTPTTEPCPNDCEDGRIYTADAPAPEGKPCSECDGEGRVA